MSLFHSLHRLLDKLRGLDGKRLARLNKIRVEVRIQYKQVT